MKALTMYEKNIIIYIQSCFVNIKQIALLLIVAKKVLIMVDDYDYFKHHINKNIFLCVDLYVKKLLKKV